MGRELKKVSLDFSWPRGKIWKGFINPHPYHECAPCGGMGYSEEYRNLKDIWYNWTNTNYKPDPYKRGARYDANAWHNNVTQEDVQALIDEDRLWDFTRVARTKEHQKIIDKKIKEGGNSWLPFSNGYVPTAEEVNEWNLKGMGHDSSNCYYIIKARLEREGKSSDCPQCNGTGEDWPSDKAKDLYNNFKFYEPPEGPGFQLWENTSEGSPKSPVLKTLDELCEWCAKYETTFASFKASKEEWKEMLSDGDGIVHHKVGNVMFI